MTDESSLQSLIFTAQGRVPATIIALGAAESLPFTATLNLQPLCNRQLQRSGTIGAQRGCNRST